MTDAELLRRWHAAGDAEAFHTLVRRYSGLVYGSARRVLNSETDAEDVTQDCFERLATKRVAPRRSLGAWLHRVAVNRALDRRKADTRRKRREEAYAEQAPATKEDAWIDLAPLIDEAVNRLPRADREVIVAYFYLQRTQAEIARDLDLSRRGVSHRIQRAVTRLRAFLTDEGVTLSAATLTTLATSRLAEAAPVSVAQQLGRLALAGHHTARHSGAFLRLTDWTLAHKTAANSAPAAFLVAAKGAIIPVVAIVAITTATIFVLREENRDAPSGPSPQSSNDTPPAVQTPPNEVETIAPSPSTAPVLPTVSDDTLEQAEPLGGVIEGKVTYHGEPVPNQMVRGAPYRMAEPVFVTTTDAEGNFRVGGLEPQDITVMTLLMFNEDGERLTKPEAGEPVTYVGDDRRVSIEGQVTHRIDFELPVPPREPPENTGSLEGFVLVDGRIPEKASVDLYAADNHPVAGADVEADGSYYCGSIPAGDYFVRLYVSRPRSEEMNWWSRASIIADHVTTLDLTVDRSQTGTIRGSVFGLRDGEYANAVAFQGNVEIPSHYSRTWLSEVDAPLAARARCQKPHDEYLLEYLAPGTYTVVALITSTFARGVPHYGALDYRVVRIAEGTEATADFDFRADDPPVIQGRLIGLHPEDYASVNVYRGEFPMPVPFQESRDPSEFMATQLNAGYRRDIQLWNLKPGTYSLWASASPAGVFVGPKKTDWAIVTIPEYQEKPVSVELKPIIQTHGRTIRCLFVNRKADRPEISAYAIPGTLQIPAKVTGSFWLEARRQAAASGRALDSDTLTLTGLDPGTYTVVAFHFPVRNTREARDAAGLSGKEFYGTTIIAFSEAVIRDADEEIELELAF